MTVRHIGLSTQVAYAHLHEGHQPSCEDSSEKGKEQSKDQAGSFVTASAVRRVEQLFHSDGGMDTLRSTKP